MDYSVNMISNASLCTCRISRVQTALGWHDADDPPAWWCTVQVPVTTKVGSKQCLTQLLFNDLYIVTSHHHSELSRDSHVHTAAPVSALSSMAGLQQQHRSTSSSNASNTQQRERLLLVSFFIAIFINTFHEQPENDR